LRRAGRTQASGLYRSLAWGEAEALAFVVPIAMTPIFDKCSIQTEAVTSLLAVVFVPRCSRGTGIAWVFSEPLDTVVLQHA